MGPCPSPVRRPCMKWIFSNAIGQILFIKRCFILISTRGLFWILQKFKFPNVWEFDMLIFYLDLLYNGPNLADSSVLPRWGIHLRALDRRDVTDSKFHYESEGLLLFPGIEFSKILNPKI